MNFSDYPAPFPACLCKLGFEDLSWHNDASGRAARDVGDRHVAVVGQGHRRAGRHLQRDVRVRDEKSRGAEADMALDRLTRDAHVYGSTE